MGAASNARVVAHDPPLSIRIRRVIDWIASRLKGVGYRSHFVVTALLAAAFIPALFVSRLPVKLDWAVLLNTYWIGFAFQAMFFATLLYVIQFPAKDTIGPLWSRCQHDKRRLLVLVPVLLFLFWFYVHFRYLCAAHFSEFPSSLQTFSLQKRQLLQASSLWAGKGIESVGLDYYVAFPSLHIAMPLVVAWFLRRWKRILPLLLALDLLLVASIVLLEWHYVVDLVGGVAVAALAILVVGAPHQQPRLAGGFPGAGSD